jgi:hypothetical protein
MTTTLKIALVLSIATVICMFFAAPIVGPVSPLLAFLLIALGAFYSMGIIATIATAYRTPETKDE